MSRRSVSVRTTKTRRRGKKWSPVLIDIVGETRTISAQAAGGWNIDLCANSVLTSGAPTATVIKCGNFKVSFEVETGAANYNAVTGRCYIMFVPQGVTPDANWPQQHPEYIMAWRACQVGGNTSAVTIQSRLKRNLNSGDKVILIVHVYNYMEAQSPAIACKIVGACTYVCCNN